jgi:hypothetical protein
MDFIPLNDDRTIICNEINNSIYDIINEELLTVNIRKLIFECEYEILIGDRQIHSAELVIKSECAMETALESFKSNKIYFFTDEERYILSILKIEFFYLTNDLHKLENFNLKLNTEFNIYKMKTKILNKLSITKYLLLKSMIEFFRRY